MDKGEERCPGPTRGNTFIAVYFVYYTRKRGNNRDALQLEGRPTDVAPGCTITLQIRHFCALLEFGDPDFFSGADISVSGGHLP